MQIMFTEHAEKRLKERGVKKEQVKETIEFPEYTIKRTNNEIEAYKKMAGKMLKVVYLEKEKYIKVITLYHLD